MKKLISAILSIFVVAVAGAQNYPVTQNLGNTPNTLVQTNSIRAGQGIILGSFTDTAAANALPYLKNYTGAAIWCTADSSIYVRQKSSTAAFWFKIGGAEGGATGSFWNLTGNTIAAVPAGFGLGTNSADNLPFKTDNTTRLILPSSGIVRNSGAANKYLVFDTTTKYMYYTDGGSSGGGIGSFEDSVANVRDFGAVGDGSTEDSTAFKNAIATGRPVFVPKGTYKITATLLLNSKQMIFGTGNTSIIYNPGTKAVIKTADSCTVQNLSFRGTGRTTSFPAITDQAQQMGVWVNGMNNRVDGCTFFKLNGRGVWIFSPTISNMEGNLITNNVADSNTVAFVTSFGCNYGLIANNTARYNYCGYYEEEAANMTNDGNIYQGNTHAMYWANTGMRGSVVNCQLNHSTVTFAQGNTYGMLISDCSFFNTNVNIGTVDTVKFLNFNNSRFVGCTITATRADSCQVFGGRFMQTVTVSGQGIKFHNVIGTANSVNQFWGGIGLADSSLHTRQGLSIGRGIIAPNLPTFADTTNYKPVVVNSNGTFYKATYWPSGAAYTASNGLTLSGSTFKLGGVLGENTSITQDGFTLGINDLLNFPDTTNWKPVVINTTGSGATAGTLRQATYWPGGGSSGWSLTGNTLGAYGSYLGTNDSYDLRFFTNNTERMRIDSSLGSVGIGIIPQTDYMMTIKSNATTSGVLKLTSNQTSLNYLQLHNDGYGDVGYITSIFAGAQYVINSSSGSFRMAQGANLIQTWNLDEGTTISRRFQTKQGADVASAAGAITLGGDGNVFEITGTSAITAINNTNWQNGATVTLLFTSTASLTHGTANSGTSIGFELAGAANFNGTAGDVVVLVLSEIGGTQRWRMVSASVN